MFENSSSENNQTQTIAAISARSLPFSLTRLFHLLKEIQKSPFVSPGARERISEILARNARNRGADD